MCWPNLRTCLNFYSRGRWPSPGKTAWWTRTYREYIYWQISWVKQRGGPTNHSKNTELQGKGRSPIIDSAQSIQALVGNMNCKLYTTTSNKAGRRMTESREEEYRTRIHQLTVLDPESWHEQTKNPWFGEGETSAICERLLVDHLYAQLGFVEFKSCAGRNVPEKLKKTPCEWAHFLQAMPTVSVGSVQWTLLSLTYEANWPSHTSLTFCLSQPLVLPAKNGTHHPTLGPGWVSSFNCWHGEKEEEKLYKKSAKLNIWNGGGVICLIGCFDAINGYVKWTELMRRYD